MNRMLVIFSYILFNKRHLHTYIHTIMHYTSVSLFFGDFLKKKSSKQQRKKNKEILMNICHSVAISVSTAFLFAMTKYVDLNSLLFLFCYCCPISFFLICPLGQFIDLKIICYFFLFLFFALCTLSIYSILSVLCAKLKYTLI